jgi:hypothetical protein
MTNPSLLRMCAALAFCIVLGYGRASGSTATYVWEADTLYMQAAAVVGSSRKSVDPEEFFSRERAFERSIGELAPTGEIESPAAQLQIRLGQFDSFAYTAVLDSENCDGENARLNLRVAFEILGELHRIQAGRGDSTWIPPSFPQAELSRTESSCHN